MLHRQFAKVRPFEEEFSEKLIRAVRANLFDKVAQLLEDRTHEERLLYVKLTLKTQAGREVNLLHLAVMAGHYEMVKTLVSACLDRDLLTIPTIDVDDTKYKRRWTPIQLAERKQYWNIAVYLQHHEDNLASDPSIYKYARKLDTYILSAKAQKFDELAQLLRQHKMKILNPNFIISEVLENWLEQFPNPTPQHTYFTEKKSLWASFNATFKPVEADSSKNGYETLLLEINNTVCQFQSKRIGFLSMLRSSGGIR